MKTWHNTTFITLAVLATTFVAPTVLADDIGHGAGDPSHEPTDPSENDASVWEELLEWFDVESE